MSKTESGIKPSELTGKHVGRVIKVEGKKDGNLIAIGIFKGLISVDYTLRVILESSPLMVPTDDEKHRIFILPLT